MRSYLDPTAPTAPDALLTDDPKGAMDLAIALCESPRMSNLAHGLWGYHGKTNDGTELTIQSLGIGGPSAAAVMTDLAGLGVRRAIRIGSCIPIGGAMEPGASLVATSFEPGDGAGFALAEGGPVAPDQALTEAVILALPGASTGTVRSTDLASANAAGGDAVAADLSSAAFAAAGARDGVACACALLAVGPAGGSRVQQEAVESALIGLGVQAAKALEVLAQAAGS